MSDFLNMKSDLYKKEIMDTLQKLIDDMPEYEEFIYFVKCMREHYLTKFEKGSPNIVVIGSDIPEELVLAATKMSYWILGGSRISSMWADNIVPRDTDPVSKSSIGYIKSCFKEKSLILIPLVNDSTRKLAYILKSEGFKVQTVHLPPFKNADSKKEWNNQYEKCRTAISFHIKKH